MNKDFYDREVYCQTDLSPDGVKIGHSRERSLVNSICIITGDKWENVVKNYIEQCHFRSNMASYKTCITDTLRANGFTPYNKVGRLQDMLDFCNFSIQNRNMFIVKTAWGYMSVVPNESCKRYVLKGALNFKITITQLRIEEAWLYMPGTDNRTGIKRIYERKQRTKETNSLTVKNLNPDDKNVGDCVIRGLSAVYGCTWHEAMDLIAESTCYSDPLLNITPNIHTTLIKLGFERHRTNGYNGRSNSGKNLCHHLDRTYSNGERIFAFVGNHHCAAILPVKLPDGSVKYKIQDTWDSTEKKIEEYWVYYPNDNKNKVTPGHSPVDTKPQFQISNKIFHPQFGKGVIVDINGKDTSRILIIQFDNVGVKHISESWLRTH